MPRSRAILAATNWQYPSNSASASSASLSPTMCFLGMINTWVGACGLISSKAKLRSSSYTFLEGILPAMILQKRQSVIPEIVTKLFVTHGRGSRLIFNYQILNCPLPNSSPFYELLFRRRILAEDEFHQGRRHQRGGAGHKNHQRIC